MKKMRNLMILSVAILCLALTGCGKDKGTGESNIDGSALAQRLAQEVAFEDQLTQVEEETALALYGLSSDQAASAVVYVGTGATAEEIAVLEGVDGKSAEAIKTQVDERISSQLADYGDYKPEEVPKLENPVLETKGKFVILCISGDNETAKSIIDEMVK